MVLLQVARSETLSPGREAGPIFRTDPIDNATTWTYDALFRVVQETNELGQSRNLAHDDGSYLPRRIDQRGLVRESQEIEHLLGIDRYSS